MSFEIGILARAADVAHRVRFGPKRPRYYGWATHTPTPYVFRCAANGCTRATDTIYASIPDDAEYLVERAGWRLSLGLWSCPDCAYDAAVVELQNLAAIEHGAVERARTEYELVRYHEIYFGERLARHAEARAVNFLACWWLRFSEPETEPWA